MESLKKIGQICRQHYEKILLILVLIGVALAVAFLYEASQSEAEKLTKFLADVGKRSGKPVKAVDLSRAQAVLEQAQKPPTVNFSAPHNLFNPVKWQRQPNGSLIPFRSGDEIVKSIEIVKKTPLNFIIALDRVAGSTYHIIVTNEVTLVPSLRKIAQFATLNSTNNKVFILRDVKGPPEDPTELVLELKDTGERVSIGKDKPYVRTDAYEVDLKSSFETKTYSKQRVGATVRLGGDDYKIVAITQNEVVLSANLNDKKYTIRQAAAP